ncbi:hypothetical protein ACFL02_03855 [Planctomycetota bacterium]
MADENKKGLDNLSVEARRKEINTIRHLFDTFGEPAFRSIQKYHFSTGYQRGFEILNDLLAEENFLEASFRQDPVGGVRDFLISYFKRRGGNMPEIWSENNIVYLKTAAEVFCITEEAEKQASKCHSDVCNIYCRSFIRGYVSIIEEVLPGIIINFYNVSSRRDDKRSDCVEAFQVERF